MRKTHLLVGTAVVATSLLASPGPAGAAPAGAPVAFDCGGAGSFTGVANSGNSQALTWNPFFLTAPDGAHALLIPTLNDIVVTVDGAIVFAPHASKGSTSGSVTCALSGQVGPASISGSVTGDLVAS